MPPTPLPLPWLLPEMAQIGYPPLFMKGGLGTPPPQSSFPYKGLMVNWPASGEPFGSGEGAVARGPTLPCDRKPGLRSAKKLALLFPRNVRSFFHSVEYSNLYYGTRVFLIRNGHSSYHLSMSDAGGDKNMLAKGIQILFEGHIPGLKFSSTESA